jgi:hypothetical protein
MGVKLWLPQVTLGTSWSGRMPLRGTDVNWLSVNLYRGPTPARSGSISD